MSGGRSGGITTLPESDTPTVPLTDLQIKNARAEGKTKKLFDGGGLFLEVPTSGNKRFRLKYRIDGKEKLLALGIWPEVSLKTARLKREEAKKLLSEGTDPGEKRKVEKLNVETTLDKRFDVVAQEWLQLKQSSFAPSHWITISRRLKNDAYPLIGDKDVGDITPPILLEVIRRVEARGVEETAHRLLTNFNQVFKFAVAKGMILSNPARDLRDALTPTVKSHLAAVTDPSDAARLMSAISSYRGGIVVSSALNLAPHVFVRPGELRTAKWEEVDLEKAEWRFQSSKTKLQHIVPLSMQAVAILRELKPFTCQSKFVFPSPRSNERPMSENAILAALRSLGIAKEEMSGHGFRAMARTILDEVLNFPPHLIEHQLAHAVKDANGRAYNRTTHLPERKVMMQKWSDYLLSLEVSK